MTDRRAAPPKMTDIADLAGVSVATVSRALAGSARVSAETRERIQALARRHGYVVDSIASSFRSRQTRTIAAVISLTHDTRQGLSDPFFMEMLARLADAAATRGYDLLLHKVTAPTPDWIGASVSSRRADGAILLGQGLEHAAINAAARSGLPVVAWGARLPRQAYPVVGTDNALGARLATEHLIGRGRRRLAFLGDRRLPEIERRHAGFLDALAAAGLPAPPDLWLAAGFTAESGFAAARDATAAGLVFDGLVAATDMLAIGALRALAAGRRRVPEDVAVTGFDDLPVAAYAMPGLTTVRQDIAAGAEHLIVALLDRIAGRKAVSVQMTPVLVARQSA